MSQHTAGVKSRARGQSFLNLDGGSTSPNRLDPPPSVQSRRPRKNSQLSNSSSSPSKLDLSARFSDTDPTSPSRAKRSSAPNSPGKSSRQRILDGIDQHRSPIASTSSSTFAYTNRDLPDTPITLLPPSKSGNTGSALRANHLGSLPNTTKKLDISRARGTDYAAEAKGDVPISPRLTSFSRRLRSKSSANDFEKSRDRMDRTPTSDQATDGLGILNIDSYASVQPEFQEVPSHTSRSSRFNPAQASTQNVVANEGKADGPSTARNGSTTTSASSRGGKLSKLTYKKTDATSFASHARTSPADRNSVGSNRSSGGTSSSAVKGLGSAMQPFQASESSQGGTSAYQSRDRPVSGTQELRGSRSELATTGKLEYTDALTTQTAHLHGDISIDTSAPNTSRAASLRSMQGGYHDRFSKLSNRSDRHSGNSAVDHLSSNHSSGGLPRPSFEEISNLPRGTLSDAAIVALGTIPGKDPASLLNENGAALSSKNILTIALQKAQSAVQLDSANDVPEAISAYKQAVRLLEEVMERIAPRSGKRSRPSREEERRRLLVIHNTYADRIRLLSMIYAPDHATTNEQSDHNDEFALQDPISRADWLDRVRDDSRTSPLPSPTGLAVQQSSFLPITPMLDHFQSRFVDAAASSSTTDAATARADAETTQQTEAPALPTSLSSPPLTSSPRRRTRKIGRPDSRDSRNSRTSISLSIADEQEVRERAIGPPRIEEEHTASDSTPRAGAREPTEPSADRNFLSNDSQISRGTSDSLQQNKIAPGRLKTATMSTTRALGVDDELGSPSTPFFDAADMNSTQDSQPKSTAPADSVRRSKTSQNERSRADSNERAPKMGFAQRARALSFKGPLLRQKMSMPMLSDRKGGERNSADAAAAAAARDAQRPSSADSPPGDLTSSVRVQTGSAPDSALFTLKSSAFGLNRPRAATNVAGNNVFSSSAADLVTLTTPAGTVGQRRKNPLNGQSLLLRKSSDISSEFRKSGGESTAVPALPTSANDDSERSLPTSPFNRARSLSQPGSKRPPIPASFVDVNGLTHSSVQNDLPPPVPDLALRLSVLELEARAKQSTPAHGASDEITQGRSAAPGFALPFPEQKADKDGRDTKASVTMLVSDIFPSGLPSLAAGAPSYASVRHHEAPTRTSKVPVASHALLRPYFVIQQLLLSISKGAQVTDRLFVPQALWMQSGVKLTAVDTKIRAIDLLASGIEAVERGGDALLRPLGSNSGLETSNASRFLRQLEDFEGLLVAVQSNLAKKLPILETKSSSTSGTMNGGTVSKGSKSLSSFSSRLTRMAGVGQAKAQDTSSILLYVESLSNLFRRSSTLCAHTTSLLLAQGLMPPSQDRTPSSLNTSFDSVGISGSSTAASWMEPLQSPAGVATSHANLYAYSALPSQIKQTIHIKLAKCSEFFARVILVFVLQDLTIMMDKFVKKGSAVFAD